MTQDSSIDPDIGAQAHNYTRDHDCIFVMPGSNDTHEHVRAGLKAYAPPAVKQDCYAAFDSDIEGMPDGRFSDRPREKKHKPKTAVREHLRRVQDRGRRDSGGTPLTFAKDRNITNILRITAVPDGYPGRFDR